MTCWFDTNRKDNLHNLTLCTTVEEQLMCDCNGFSTRAGAELYFPNVQPSDAGVYVCTCRDQRSTNRSRAEIVVTSVYETLEGEMFLFSLITHEHLVYVPPGVPTKPIEVTVEEPKAQTVRVGSAVSFICTATSKVTMRRLCSFTPPTLGS